MKKISMLLMVTCSILLSGCSLENVKTDLDNALQRALQKDQEHEQGFVVDKGTLYASFVATGRYIDLSQKGLTTIPDICALLDPKDYEEVWFLNLSHNKIRIIDQNLSCLTKLKVLNLSYNNIAVVVRLGSLPALQELLLDQNKLETTSELPDFPGLQKLSLAYNKLKEVAGLEKYTNLVGLDLQHNLLEKLVGVEKLKKLEELRVAFNQLKDLPFLDTLQKLKTVTTEGNNLLDEVQKKIDAWKKYIPSTNTGTGA